PYADRLLQCLEGRIGARPDEARWQQLCTQAKSRYDSLIPPGFADVKEKQAPDSYGDYIGWMQLIEIAKRESRGAILVTDDFKADWWRIEKERTIGPRPELIDEFMRESGQSFFLYTSENFLREAKQRQYADVDDKAIEEVRERLESQRERQLPS